MCFIIVTNKIVGRKYKEDVLMDWRNIKNGLEIPTEHYSDQPYLIKTDDGAWLCQLTTGPGEEGRPGEHIISTRSFDQGRTWSDPVDVEPIDEREASYGVLAKAPGGRVFCFYNYNTNNVRSYVDKNPVCPDYLGKRVDMLGDFVFKYSDDHGKTWSKERINIPIRKFKIDYENYYKGEMIFFWNVGRTFELDGRLYVSLHRIGYDENDYFFYRTEGSLLMSEDILHIKNPAEANWVTLPEGDTGLKTPQGGGLVAEEHSYVTLSDKSIYSTYRTTDGMPACTYSRDGGKTWEEPEYVRYEDGRLVRHPRAANFVWKCENGKFLYWYHNNFGKWFADRNPVWLCCGEEVDTPQGKKIAWSQPEIVLYDDDPFIRISYPDFIEDNGKYYISETQKDFGRIHELDDSFINGLLNQSSNKTPVKNGLILEARDDNGIEKSLEMPDLYPLLNMDPEILDRRTKDFRGGFTSEFIFNSEKFADQLLIDNTDYEGKGFSVKLLKNKTLEISISDGRSTSLWQCDHGMLEENRDHHVSIIIDGGPKIIIFIIDGKVCDGAGLRQYGWGRYNPNLRSIKGSDTILPGIDKVKLKCLKLYNRHLTTSECVGIWRHETK